MCQLQFSHSNLTELIWAVSNLYPHPLLRLSAALQTCCRVYFIHHKPLSHEQFVSCMHPNDPDDVQSAWWTITCVTVITVGPVVTFTVLGKQTPASLYRQPLRCWSGMACSPCYLLYFNMPVHLCTLCSPEYTLLRLLLAGLTFSADKVD